MISSTTRSDLQFGAKLALMQREASLKHFRTGSMCHESLRFQDLLVSSVACLWPGAWISAPGCCSRVPVACSGFFLSHSQALICPLVPGFPLLAAVPGYLSPFLLQEAGKWDREPFPEPSPVPFSACHYPVPKALTYAMRDDRMSPGKHSHQERNVIFYD